MCQAFPSVCVCVGSGGSGSGPANHSSSPPGTVFTLYMCVSWRVIISVCVCVCVCTLGYSHCDVHANVSPQQIEKPD